MSMLHRNRKNVMKLNGFSLTEFMVSLAILMMFLSLLQPSLQKIMATGRTLTCGKQSYKLATELTMYVEDHNERFPTLNNYQANPNYGSGSPDTANKLFYDLMDDTQVLLPYTGYETQRELVDSGTLLCPSDDVPASSPGEDRLSYVVTEYDTNKKGDAIEFGLISQLHINKNVTFESVSLMDVEQPSGTIMWGERWYGTVIVDDTITYNAIPKFDANPVKNVNKLTLGSIQDPELGYLCHPETGGPTFLMVDMSLKRMIYQEVIEPTGGRQTWIDHR